MDYDHKKILARVERIARQEMKRIEKEYPDLINGYNDIESMNGEEAHSLGWWSACSDVVGTIEGMKRREDAEANRIERRKIRVFGQGKV